MTYLAINCLLSLVLKGLLAWFQVALMKKWQCPIYSGTLQTLFIKNKEETVVFWN